MATLYEITKEYLDVLDNLEVDEETGEITGAERLDEMEGSFDQKAEAVACFVKNAAAMAESIKEEEKTLKKRRESLERRNDYLKQLLQNSLDAVGKAKLETPKVVVSFRKSKAIQIDDEAAVPAAFKSEVVSVKIDKTLIKQAIQLGQQVPGAALVENRNIQIR